MKRGPRHEVFIHTAARNPAIGQTDTHDRLTATKFSQGPNVMPALGEIIETEDLPICH